MSSPLRSRITYANVMSTVAVFIALGGGAWAVTGRPAASGHNAASRAGTSPSNDVFRACVQNRTGAVRIVGVGSHCSRREHHIFWVSFNGHFDSDHKRSSIDVSDSGIVLNSTAAGQAPRTIKLTPGGVVIDEDGVQINADGSISLSAGHNLTTTVDKNSTLVVHGNQTTTIDRNLVSAVHQSEAATVDLNRATTVGGASQDTVGGFMTEATGGSLTTSIGGNQRTTINGDSSIKAVGGTLDTTAATITNNADLIQNASDGILVNSAGTTLTNHADGALVNSAGQALVNTAGTRLTNRAGTSLTNQATTDLLNKAGRDLTNQSGSSMFDKAALNLTVQASSAAILSAPAMHLGCPTGQGAARLNDPVSVTSPSAGQISGASTTVFVC